MFYLEKWIVGQAMDNRLVLFQLIDDKLKFSKKHAFRGHNVAGYACTSDYICLKDKKVGTKCKF